MPEARRLVAVGSRAKRDHHFGHAYSGPSTSLLAYPISIRVSPKASHVANTWSSARRGMGGATVLAGKTACECVLDVRTHNLPSSEGQTRRPSAPPNHSASDGEGTRRVHSRRAAEVTAELRYLSIPTLALSALVPTDRRPVRKRWSWNVENGRETRTLLH